MLAALVAERNERGGKKAQAAYEAAIAKEPRFQRARYRLAMLVANKGNEEVAERYMAERYQ